MSEPTPQITVPPLPGQPFSEAIAEQMAAAVREPIVVPVPPRAVNLNGGGTKNPWTLKPNKPRVTEYKEFTDSETGEVFIFGARRIDGVEMTNALSDAGPMVQEFATTKPGEEPTRYPCGDGKTRRLNQTFINNCFYYLAMQEDVPEEQQYGFDALVGLAVCCAEVYMQLMNWALINFLPGASTAGNLAGNLTASSLGRSSETDGNTPPLSSEQTGSATLSTTSSA